MVVPSLEQAIEDRAVETVDEERLLALAYQQMQKPDDAWKRLSRSEAWLDALRPANEPDLPGRILGSAAWVDVQIFGVRIRRPPRECDVSALRRMNDLLVRPGLTAEGCQQHQRLT